jgi:formylglycine-generating enzyme required for sulfatase activity
MWIGMGFLSLLCLALLAFGASRLFSSGTFQTKPTQILNPVVPNTAVGPLPSETPSLPSAQEMVEVPGGTYEVGTTLFTDDYHIPPQQISLEGFWIDKYLVTNAQYQQFMTETGAPQPVTWPGEGDHPVLGVTWEQAQAYCEKANKHLPSEAQWEAAGRGSGPAPRPYPWGNDSTASGNALNLPDDDTYAVGTQSFNQSPFGVFDMVGNVWEWVGEPYAGEQAGYSILRGGRFGLPINDLSYRLPVASDDTRYLKYAGFRCAADQVQ